MPAQQNSLRAIQQKMDTENSQKLRLKLITGGTITCRERISGSLLRSTQTYESENRRYFNSAFLPTHFPVDPLVTDATASVILHFSSGMVFFLAIVSPTRHTSTQPHQQQSHGMRSGDLVGQKHQCQVLFHAPHELGLCRWYSELTAGWWVPCSYHTSAAVPNFFDSRSPF